MKSILLVLSVFVATCGSSVARPVLVLTDEQLQSQSDLIVIATPICVRDTNQKTAFLGILRDSQPVAAVKMEADFEILSILKGTPPALKKLTLDYLRELNSTGGGLNGPSLVSFDPSRKETYRLCLKLGENGHYSAITGQTDPSYSIVLWGSHP